MRETTRIPVRPITTGARPTGSIMVKNVTNARIVKTNTISPRILCIVYHLRGHSDITRVPRDGSPLSGSGTAHPGDARAGPKFLFFPGVGRGRKTLSKS